MAANGLYLHTGPEHKKRDHDYHKPKEEEMYPWKNPNIREDVHKVFTVKLQEEYILKIKFICKRSGKAD